MNFKRLCFFSPALPLVLPSSTRINSWKYSGGVRLMTAVMVRIITERASLAKMEMKLTVGRSLG